MAATWDIGVCLSAHGWKKWGCAVLRWEPGAGLVDPKLRCSPGAGEPAGWGNLKPEWEIPGSNVAAGGWTRARCAELVLQGGQGSSGHLDSEMVQGNQYW